MRAKLSLLKTNSNFQTSKGRGYSREREQHGQGIRKETNTEVEPNLDAPYFCQAKRFGDHLVGDGSHSQTCISRTDAYLSLPLCLLCPIHPPRFPFLSTCNLPVFSIATRRVKMVQWAVLYLWHIATSPLPQACCLDTFHHMISLATPHPDTDKIGLHE